MNQRWYDQYPAVCLAIKLLQKTPYHSRNEIVKNMKARIYTEYPGIAIMKESERRWLIHLFQKRRAMNEEAWMMIELLKYLPEEGREKLALEIIQQSNAVMEEEDSEAEEDSYSINA